MAQLNIEPSITYERVRELQVEDATVTKIYGPPIGADNDKPTKEQEKALRFMRLFGCFCVQDTPESPCLCGSIIWIPWDKIVRIEKSERKNDKGQKLSLVTVYNDAEIVVERLTRMKAIQYGQRPYRTHARKDGVAYRTSEKGALLIAAFELGWVIGTKIDEETGLSDTISDWLYDWFGP